MAWHSRDDLSRYLSDQSLATSQGKSSLADVHLVPGQMPTSHKGGGVIIDCRDCVMSDGLPAKTAYKSG